MLVMGVVNVTPDSFSDGGRWYDADAAVAHGQELAAAGAAIVDVGGESTRPGAERPDEPEELRRVVPVVRRLAATGVQVSIDTMRARVAATCLDAGATLVNDVSGGLADPAMLPLVAQRGVPYVVMHWRDFGATMQSKAQYGDVVADVTAELAARVEAALSAGIARERLIIDPGLGFAKTAEHNWALLGGLDRLRGLGLPLLVGASRKRFLGLLDLRSDGQPAPPDAREAATIAVTLLAAQAGAWAVRVHDVAGSVAALRVLDAVARAGDGHEADDAFTDGLRILRTAELVKEVRG